MTSGRRRMLRSSTTVKADQPKPDREESQNGKPAGLQVIGAGLLRTGTTSLKMALEHLLDGQCYHMSDIFGGKRSRDIPVWLRLFELRRNGGLYYRPDDASEGQLSQEACHLFHSIYDNCVAAVDYPTSVFWEELMELYPNAKVILSLRDADQWLVSCRETILSSRFLTKAFGTYDPFVYLVERLRGVPGLTQLHNEMFSVTFGQGDGSDAYSRISDDELTRAFNQWNAKVTQCVPQGRLIILPLNSVDWPLLTDRLPWVARLPVSSDPYPHYNARQSIVKGIDDYIHFVDKCKLIATRLPIVIIVLLLVIAWLSMR